MRNKDNPIVLLHSFDRFLKSARDWIGLVYEISYVLDFPLNLLLLISQLMFRMEIRISIN